MHMATCKALTAVGRGTACSLSLHTWCTLHLQPHHSNQLQESMLVFPQAVAEVCAVCNDAHIEYKDGKFHAVGAPTEAALSVLVEKLGVTDSGVSARIQQQRSSQSEGHADFVCQAYCRRYCAPDVWLLLSCYSLQQTKMSMFSIRPCTK